MPKDNNGIKTVLIEDKSKIPAFLRSGFRVLFFAAMKLLKIQYKLNKEKKKNSPLRISEVKICFISLCIPCMKVHYFVI
jgi:hypothetical protein